MRERGYDADEEAKELDTTPPQRIAQRARTLAFYCEALQVAEKRAPAAALQFARGGSAAWPVQAGDAAPADALDLCFLLYRRLDCVDYAFYDLILQVEYAG